MRIALVAPFGLRAKGTTRARGLPLARELARRGHSVALFIPPYDSPEDSGRRWREEVAPRGAGSDTICNGPQQGNGVDVINLALPDPGRGGAAWHLRLGWRLFLAVHAWRPDVVHVFKPKGPSGLAGALLWISRRRTKDQRPTAISFVLRHPSLVIDSDDWEGPGGWNDDPRAGYSLLQRRFFAWQERFGLSHADAWTVTSACLRQRAIGFGADPVRVFVLHNGVTDAGSGVRDQGSGVRGQGAGVRGQGAGIRDQGSGVRGQGSCITHHASRIRKPIRHSQSAILYTRFAGTRPADVAAIWAKVRQRASEATLTVVGRGLGGEERELAGLAGIEIQGWVEPAEMPALFAGMSLAVVPWADTPSNRARHSAKVLELMAAGLPIVACAVGELPVTLGETGVLVPAGDWDSFAAAVTALLDDPERAARLGAAAQARVRVEFTWARLADVALTAYGTARIGSG